MHFYILLFLVYCSIIFLVFMFARFVFYYFFFVSKQKTAYEVRISDWSSRRVLFRSLPVGRIGGIGAGETYDVEGDRAQIGLGRLVTGHIEVAVRAERNDHSARVLVRRIDEGPEYGGDPEQTRNRDLEQRSEERRGGKEGVSTCRCWWAPGH